MRVVTTMVEPSPLFKTLSVEPDPATPAASQDIARKAQENAVAIQMIRMALSAIWQQYVIAVSHLYVLASGASVFVLWLSTPDPKPSQLTAMGMYAGFVLASNLLVIWSRRK